MVAWRSAQSLLFCAATSCRCVAGAGEEQLGCRRCFQRRRVADNARGKAADALQESLSLQGIEDFLDDFQRDGYGGGYQQPPKMSGSGGSSTQLFDISATVPAMLDCLTIQNPSRFCTGSVSETSSGSLTTQESDIYQMGSVGTAPSSQKLLQENQQEQQQQVQPLPLPATPPQPPPTTQSLQQQPQSLNHTLMVSLPLGSEQAFETEERVHVIDLDILQGYQWPAFMQALAARPGGAPFLRITGVGSSMENVKETGRCLTELAHFLHVPLEYHPVAEELVDLKPHMFNRRVGEVLAVNSANRLHRVPGNCLGNLLAMIRDQAPNIVTVVKQEDLLLLHGDADLN